MKSKELVMQVYDRVTDLEADRERLQRRIDDLEIGIRQMGSALWVIAVPRDDDERGAVELAEYALSLNKHLLRDCGVEPRR